MIHGKAVALGQVLPGADQEAEILVLDDRVIDVLARVQLAAPDGRLVGDPEVLGEHGIEAQPPAAWRWRA